jgi:hypothetical protein
MSVLDEMFPELCAARKGSRFVREGNRFVRKYDQPVKGLEPIRVGSDQWFEDQALEFTFSVGYHTEYMKWKYGHLRALQNLAHEQDMARIDRAYPDSTVIEKVMDDWGVPYGIYRDFLNLRLMCICRDSYCSEDMSETRDFEPRNSTERGMALELWLHTL